MISDFDSQPKGIYHPTDKRYYQVHILCMLFGEVNESKQYLEGLGVINHDQLHQAGETYKKLASQISEIKQQCIASSLSPELLKTVVSTLSTLVKLFARVQRGCLFRLQRCRPELNIISNAIALFLDQEKSHEGSFPKMGTPFSRGDYMKAARIITELPVTWNGAHCVFRLETYQPQWALSRFVELVVYLAQIGWNHRLWPRAANESHCNCADGILLEAMKTDDIDMFRECLVAYDLTPWDISGQGLPSFLTTATIHGAFAICNYLLDLGVEDRLRMGYSPSIMAGSFKSHFAIPEMKSMIPHLRRFVQHENHVASKDDRLLACLHVQLSGETFAEIRRLICPDKDFYGDGCRSIRVEFLQRLYVVRTIDPDVIRSLVMSPAPEV